MMIKDEYSNGLCCYPCGCIGFYDEGLNEVEKRLCLKHEIQGILCNESILQPILTSDDSVSVPIYTHTTTFPMSNL